MPADCKSLNSTASAGLSAHTCSILSKYSESLGSNVSSLLNKVNDHDKDHQSNTDTTSTSNNPIGLTTDAANSYLGDNPLRENSTHNLSLRDNNTLSRNNSCDNNGNEDSGVSSTAGEEVLRRRDKNRRSLDLETSGINKRENRLSAASTQSRNGNTCQR